MSTGNAEPWSLLGTSCTSCAAWILTALAVFAAYVLWAQTYWARRGVPQTRPWVLLGDLVDTMILRRTLGDVLNEIYRNNQGKPYVGLYKFLSPVLLVRDVDLAKEVLVQNFTSFQNNAAVFPPEKDQVFSDNPFMADADRWKDLRTRLSQMFTPARVRLTFDDMVESARRLVDYLEAAGENVSQDSMLVTKRYTAYASVRILFGIESSSLEVGSAPGVFYEMGHRIFNGGFMTTLRFIAFVSCPSLLPLIGYEFVGQETLGFFRKLIQDSIEYRQKEGISRDDFVQHVSKQVLVDGKVDEKALRTATAQAINTFVETFETSAITTTTVLLMLATHPDAQDKLRKELRAAVPDGKTMDHDVVAGLSYLDWVVKESLRLFPVADTLRRMCTKTTTLRAASDDGPGVEMHPGNVVYLSCDALHRDPALYSHPDEFWPEHFSDEELERRPKNVFFGFGEGPRHCPGMRYGMQQIKTAIASILLRLEVTPGPEQVLPVVRDPAASFMGFKGGVWLRFKPVS